MTETAMTAQGLICFNFASSVARGTLIFIVNLYAIHSGATLVELGLIRGISGIGLLLSVLPAGVLVDVFGARRFYILGEFFGAAMSVLLIAVTEPKGLIVWSALFGFTMAFRFTSLQAIFLERLSGESAGMAGWFRASNFLGMMFVGPFAGSFLVGSLSYARIFVLTGAMMFALSAMAFLYMKGGTGAAVEESAGKPPGTFHRPARRQFADLLKNRAFVHATLSEGLNSACFSIFSIFTLVVALDIFHFPPERAGHLVSAGGAIFVIVVSLGGLLPVRERGARWMTVGLGGMVAGLILLATAPSLPQYILGTVVLGASMGLTTLLTYTQISGTEGRKGKIVGLYAASTSIGHAVGPILGGVVGKYYGPQSAFLLMVPLLSVVGFRMYTATK